jgi:tetratricopeptide (TPR) repeat protein
MCCTSPCTGDDTKNALTVKNIAFNRSKAGIERIALFCNQSCTPELSSLDGENPRVVMDMKGVSLIQAKARNVNTGGRLVKRVRSNLNKQTNILRVVLDMEPSKSFIVRPMQDPSGNFMLAIKEDADSPRSREKRITILHPDLRSGEQKGNLQKTAPNPENRSAAKAAEDLPSVDQGRSQLNDGEFAAAVDIFTQIIAAHPNDSLIYRLRGDAYDNLGDQQKALEDWTQAARLGDTIIQSYLDFLKVKWRDNPAQ